MKLENARFHFEKMRQSLEALQSAGTIIDTGWQRSFYAHLDAFLSATRSVAEVIKCCFGHDKAWQMKQWFNELPSDEQARRRSFSAAFKNDYDGFTKLPLSTARHISEHRTGYPDVTVAINGMLGVIYAGSPIAPVPISETSKIDNPDLAFLAKPLPVHPMWDDFQIDGQGLFEVCQAYLGEAENLKNAAQRIAQKVDDDKALTPPS